jgi:hypothetical protein
MVESREDIEFESDSLRDLIFDIANPDLQGKFDHKVAKSWLERLEKLQGRV